MLEIDKMSRVPIYEQVIQKLELLILTNVLGPNSPLPSVRSLSQELSVNPNTLQKAYSEMELKGICYSVPGTGRFISENAKDILMRSKREKLDQFKEIVSELKLAGICGKELKMLIDQIYNISGKEV
ncbi:MAG TPA: GntR family transcriptional regulator [Firmicutes bacterium]|nr:GntR family transcriptional regulator [Bacillota bacterium]